MAAKLLDSNGALKPFDRWLNDVLPIASHQCGSWLRTEYDTAVIRAQQAAEWKRFERDKDVLPNLKWVPSTSPNPGADHRIYWGTILPVDHPFWSRHRPGDRWNCQCSLESTDEPATGIKHEDAVDPRKNGPQKGLKDNPGKTSNLFGQDHPYYPENCSSCPFASGLTNRLGMIFRGQKRDCNRCKNLLTKLPSTTGEERRAVARALFEEYSNNPEYTDVRLNDKLGCMTATHKDHNFDKRTGYTEKAVRDVGYKSGHSVIFGKEGSGVIGERFTEGLWDGMPFEVASRETGTSNNLVSGLKHCSSKRTTKVAVIFSPTGNFDPEAFDKALRRYRGLIKNNPSNFVVFERVVYIGDGRIFYDQPFSVD